MKIKLLELVISTKQTKLDWSILFAVQTCQPEELYCSLWFPIKSKKENGIQKNKKIIQ